MDRLYRYRLTIRRLLSEPRKPVAVSTLFGSTETNPYHAKRRRPVNLFSVEMMLKIKRDDHERAAQRALLEHEIKRLKQETPKGTESFLRLTQSPGLLLPRRRNRRAR